MAWLPSRNHKSRKNKPSQLSLSTLHSWDSLNPSRAHKHGTYRKKKTVTGNRLPKIGHINSTRPILPSAVVECRREGPPKPTERINFFARTSLVNFHGNGPRVSVLCMQNAVGTLQWRGGSKGSCRIELVLHHHNHPRSFGRLEVCFFGEAILG